ncbi:MAG: sulfite exporter TauE/SafE family protein [Betaproteobacteria bacterium]|nr:sulfite exporter TauE/SafE family protein [Betaproteobacteria bacterium]
MDWWWVYLSSGALVGFLAGLLGIGGGLTLVPILVLIFTAKGFPAEHLMHLSIATSLATVVFTSVSSVRAHHQQGVVDWAIARAIVPGILTGSFLASQIAGFIPTRPLALIFTAFVIYAATQMFFDARPRSSRELPGGAGLFTAGAVIGGVSSLFAAGGAFLSIPFMTKCNVPLRRAIGTAAAIGFPIAVAGSIGYVLNGLGAQGLPAGSVGFVHLPALLLVVVPSMLCAPWGARLAHRLPVARLRVAFALLLYALAGRMLWTLW